MTNFTSKKGDIFSVQLSGNRKKFFQYIDNDSKQFDSDVIRAFKKEYSCAYNPEMAEIVNDEIDFYAHCFIKKGLYTEAWKYSGHYPFEGVYDVLFKSTTDYGRTIDGKPITVSKNWDVWKVNNHHFNVGALEGDFRKAEIGIIVIVQDIIDRMETGEYQFFYPAYQ